VHEILDERTNPTWPTTWFVPNTTEAGPFRDVYTVMANWGANHGAISYGHIGADLISLAFPHGANVYALAYESGGVRKHTLIDAGDGRYRGQILPVLVENDIDPASIGCPGGRVS